MKKFYLLILIIFSDLSFGKQHVETADWIVESGTLVIKSSAAEDLYHSLNAKEEMDSLSSNHHQLRIKRNDFAHCRANFYRSESIDEGIVWTIGLNTVCKIHAPTDSVIRY